MARYHNTLELARALAAKANECCHRSDGWEPYLTGEFDQLLKEALLPPPGDPRPGAPDCIERDPQRFDNHGRP